MLILTLALPSDFIDDKLKPSTKLRLENYWSRIKSGHFKSFVRQAKYDITCSLFGRRCPLCLCKSLDNFKTNGFTDQEICGGCRQDFDGIKGDEILQKHVMKLTGMTRKELEEKIQKYYG